MCRRYLFVPLLLASACAYSADVVRPVLDLRKGTLCDADLTKDDARKTIEKALGVSPVAQELDHDEVLANGNRVNDAVLSDAYEAQRVTILWDALPPKEQQFTVILRPLPGAPYEIEPTLHIRTDQTYEEALRVVEREKLTVRRRDEKAQRFAVVTEKLYCSFGFDKDGIKRVDVCVGYGDVDVPKAPRDEKW